LSLDHHRPYLFSTLSFFLLRPFKSRLLSAAVSCGLSKADFFRLAFFLPSSADCFRLALLLPLKSRLLSAAVSCGLSKADFFRLPFLAASQKQTSFDWRFFCLSKADFFRLPFLAASQKQTSFGCRFLLPLKRKLPSANTRFCAALPPPNGLA